MTSENRTPLEFRRARIATNALNLAKAIELAGINSVIESEEDLESTEFFITELLVLYYRLSLRKDYSRIVSSDKDPLAGDLVYAL